MTRDDSGDEPVSGQDDKSTKRQDDKSASVLDDIGRLLDERLSRLEVVWEDDDDDEEDGVGRHSGPPGKKTARPPARDASRDDESTSGQDDKSTKRDTPPRDAEPPPMYRGPLARWLFGSHTR